MQKCPRTKKLDTKSVLQLFWNFDKHNWGKDFPKLWVKWHVLESFSFCKIEVLLNIITVENFGSREDVLRNLLAYLCRSKFQFAIYGIQHHTAGSDTISIQIYMDAPPGVSKNLYVNVLCSWGFFVSKKRTKELTFLIYFTILLFDNNLSECIIKIASDY